MKKINLNHLAISLIELNPENIPELDGFKKNLDNFFVESKSLEVEIKKQIARIKYE